MSVEKILPTRMKNKNPAATQNKTAAASCASFISQYLICLFCYEPWGRDEL